MLGLNDMHRLVLIFRQNICMHDASDQSCLFYFLICTTDLNKLGCERCLGHRVKQNQW